MSGRYLGVDAGNTKTVALVATADGQVQGWGRAGSGDLYGAGEGPAEQNVTLAVRSALEMAGAEPGEVAAAAFRLAGVDWPEDVEHWQAVLAQAFPALGPVSVLNDGYAPLRWGRLDGHGVAVLAGTGPAVAARGPAGEFVGGWWIQQPLGGQAIGTAAFHAVVRAWLGLAPGTVLTGLLVEQQGVADVDELL
ncbi:MAG TPA: BadF/BadG/BcrA/BcrD ATPase family protein, partial [Actinotalea sp.]|nr:BadF/BadG/BcrA/BcrD ATPase family protein [Actinotalea sp.]